MNQLIKILEKENISTNKLDRLAYSTDASQVSGNAVAVIWPENKQQIQKIIRYVVKNKLNLVPRGAGTGLAGAAVPQDSVVLDFSRMNKILEINIKKGYCIVQPGVVLDDLNYILQSKDLFFPIIPSSHAVCQLGGMIATNAAGNKAIKYGKTINWVEELEIIDGTGRLFKTKAVDNWVGKEGTTGIITQAKLKLTKPLTNTSLTFYKFDETENVAKKVKEIKNKKTIVAIEFINKLAAKLSNLNGNHLLVEYESDEGKISDPKQIEKIWRIREDLGPVLTSNGYVFMEDPLVPIEHMSEFLQWLDTNQIPTFGHIGIGVLHPRFRKQETHLISEMFAMVKTLNGSVTGEHGIGLNKKQFADKKLVKKIKKLKQKYDPDNILNKGKII
jgi:FAD/FMN-containing dehydrogenase